MNTKPPLLLYFIACLIFLFAVYFDNNEIMLLSKPVIAPTVLFHYFQENRRKINWNYIFIIVLFFIGDMLVLIDFEGTYFVVISVFLIAYCFFLKSITDELLQTQLKIKQKMNFLFLLISIFFLIYLLVTILDLITESQADNLYLYLFYGLVLVVIGGISFINYALKQTKSTFFMLISTLCIIFSDVFFVLKTHFEELEIFSLFNSLPQMLSYYYITNYYMLKPVKQNLEWKTIKKIN